MKRISLTIPQELLSRVDVNAKYFSGDLDENRSKYICQILASNVPTNE